MMTYIWIYFASMSLKELIIGCNIHAHIHKAKKGLSASVNNVLLLKLDSLGQRKLFTVVDGATERGEKYMKIMVICHQLVIFQVQLATDNRLHLCRSN